MKTKKRECLAFDFKDFQKKQTWLPGRLCGRVRTFWKLIFRRPAATSTNRKKNKISFKIKQKFTYKELS